MPEQHEFEHSVLTGLLFEEPGVGRCLVAPDGSIVRANAEWLRSTALSLDDVLGADIISLFPETRDMALAMHARARAGHRVEVPRHARTVNGREAWWEGSIAPVPMEDGTGLLITVREVRTGFQLFYETAPVPFLVLAPDRARFTIVAASDAYLRATKTTRDIIGRGIFEVFPDDPSDPASTGRPARASFERVLDTGAADTMAVQKHSVRRPEAEGGGFEEHYWSPINTPILGADGKVLFIHHRVEDVTEFVRQKRGRAEERSITGMLRTRVGEMEADIVRRAAELQDVNRALRAANERLAELDRERERRTQERTALLYAISDTSDDVIFAKDRGGRMRFSNPAALKLIGKPLDEVIGRTDAEFLHDPATAGAVMENDRRIMSSGHAEEVEEHVPLPDGTKHVWLSRKVPYRDASGRVDGLLGISRDITERKRAEERAAADLAALTRMHALSARMIEAASIEPLLRETMAAAVAVVAAHKGTLQLLEGKTLKIVAHYGHEAPFLDFFANAENVASVCGEATRQGERVVVPDVESSPIFIGTPSLPVLRAAGVRAVQSTPLRTRAGRLLGILTTHWSQPHTPDEHDLWRLDLLVRQAADLIERKQADEALRDSEARFKAMADGTPILIWSTDPAGRVLFVNRAYCAFFATSQDEIATSGWQPLVHPDDAPAYIGAFMASLGSRSPFRSEARVRRGDGEWRWIESVSLPRVDENGNLISVLGSSSDITERKRAEEELRRSERTFAELVERAPFGIYVVDSRFRVAHMNAGSRAGAFRNVRPVIGRDFSEAMRILWPEPVAAEIISVFRHTLATGEPFFSPRFTNPRADVGVVESYEWELHRIELPDGQHGVICYYFDSTKLREAEVALRESEQQLRMATTGANIGVWSWIPGTSELVVSSSWRELFGVAADERITFETWRDALHPEDRERAVLALNEAAAAHREFNTEYRVVQPDGTLRWIVDRGRASYDGNGRAVLMGGVNVDITERKRAEEDLAVVTRLYAVLSRVNEVIVRTRDDQSLYDAVCRIVAEVGGFPLVWVGLVTGREVTPAAAAGSATRYLREIKVEIEGELGRGPTGTCIREDHPVINEDFDTNPSTRPWRTTIVKYGLRASAAFPLHRGGEVIGALTFYATRPGAFTSDQVKLLEALCADVSYALDSLQHERRRVEAERALRDSEQILREADRRKTDFLAVLSHELRNPLAPIRNGLYLLDHAPADSDRSARAREIIHRQTEHLTRLVDDLLDVTRIERGKVELQRSRVDARDIVRRTCDDHRRAFQLRGLELHVDLSDPAWIDADETRLAQVVGNLLQNAAKFSRQGGTVTLSVRPVDGHAELRIADDGIGIAPDLLPRIFEPFVQADGGLARTKGGLGLGLALVKGLVELHGGTVFGRSEGLGRGAEFVVALPLVPAPMPKWSAPAPSVTNASKAILVIEDNVDAAASIAEVLEMEGHRVHVATDGSSGIMKALEVRPDVVLCDIGLPDVNGYQIARTLRADPNLQSTRLIALSGYALPEDRRRAKEAGFDDHVA